MTTDRSGVICAGNWLLDIVHDLPRWPNESDLVRIGAQSSGLGGGPANVAAGLAALGVPYPIVPVGAIGDDAHGHEVRTHCARAGLRTDHLIELAGQATAHTHVMNVPGQSRTFFYKPGANDRFGPEHLDMLSLDALNARFFYLGYLTLLPRLDALDDDGRTAAARILAAARACGMRSCVDLVSTMAPDYSAIVSATLPEIDILLLNEIEAERASGVAIGGHDDVAGMTRAAGALLDGGVRHAVILHTPRQVIWAAATGVTAFDVPQAPPSEILSPVGAGDAFATGVLHGLHDDWPIADCVDLGVSVARASMRAATATGGIPALSSLDRVAT